MKRILFLVSVIFSIAAFGQTDSLAPKRFVWGNTTLHLAGTDAQEKDEYFLDLNFYYNVQTKTRVAVTELTKTVRALIPRLKPAINQWKEVNKGSADMKYWQYYKIDIGLYTPGGDGHHLFRYIVDPIKDSLADMEIAFTMTDSVQRMEYIYDIAYLDRLTGLTQAKRKKIYEQLAVKIYNCASERVMPMLAAWNEKVTQDDIDMYNRNGRRVYYLDCFRGLIRKYIRVTDIYLLKALYAELTTQLGKEDEWEIYGVKY